MLHVDVETLNADLKLQDTGWKLRNHVLELVRQVIGNHFKVNKQARHHPVQEELQYPHRGIDLQIEGAIHKLEVARAALVQRLQLDQKRIQIKGPGGFVQRAQAKLALERATTRGFDVQQAVRQIVIRVLAVRKLDVIQRRLFACDDFHQRLRAVQERAAQLGKAHITPAGDDVICKLHDGLLIHLMADLGAAQNDPDIGPRDSEQPHHLAGLRHVPDVHAETDDARRQRQQRVHDVLRLARNREFTQGRLRLQVAHVRQQVAQAERGMNVLGIERRQNDGGGMKFLSGCHGSIINLLY